MVNKTNGQLSKIVKCLILATMGCFALAMPSAAATQGYVAPKPTAQEVHWHQEFVRLFNAGHTHDAAVAADKFEQALQGVNDAQGWYILGNDFNAIDKFDRAISALNHSLTILPNNTYALNSLGVSYQKLGRNDQAMSNYRRAAALGNTTAQQNLNALIQAETAPAPAQQPGMGDKVRAIQEYENLQRCGGHSC